MKGVRRIIITREVIDKDNEPIIEAA
jgi:hypothetical protein